MTAGSISRRGAKKRPRRWLAAPVTIVLALVSAPARAQSGSSTPGQDSSDQVRWFDRVARTQAEQPHWITPLATTTPRLEEEFRYDIFWQPHPDGTTAENYGGGKGLELIPFEKVEVILSPPPYLAHNNPALRDGFGDFSFLIKYRLLSGNEARGNYILTAFLGASLPTGQAPNSASHAILTPAIAYGKGFANFDVQGNFGVALPTGDTGIIGRTYAWNNALQYRFLGKLWPEVEVNASFFQKGKNDGRKQVFLTPGLVVGKLRLWRRLGFTVGAGIQIAATHFHTSNHNAILSLRFPF